MLGPVSAAPLCPSFPLSAAFLQPGNSCRFHQRPRHRGPGMPPSRSLGSPCGRKEYVLLHRPATNHAKPFALYSSAPFLLPSKDLHSSVRSLIRSFIHPFFYLAHWPRSCKPAVSACACSAPLGSPNLSPLSFTQHCAGMPGSVRLWTSVLPCTRELSDHALPISLPPGPRGRGICFPSRTLPSSCTPRIPL